MTIPLPSAAAQSVIKSRDNIKLEWTSKQDPDKNASRLQLILTELIKTHPHQQFLHIDVKRLAAARFTYKNHVSEKEMPYLKAAATLFTLCQRYIMWFSQAMGVYKPEDFNEVESLIKSNQLEKLRNFFLSDEVNINDLLEQEFATLSSWCPAEGIFQTLGRLPAAQALSFLDLFLQVGLDVNLCYRPALSKPRMPLMAHLIRLEKTAARQALIEKILSVGADLNFAPLDCPNQSVRLIAHDAIDLLGRPQQELDLYLFLIERGLHIPADSRLTFIAHQHLLHYIMGVRTLPAVQRVHLLKLSLEGIGYPDFCPYYDARQTRRVAEELRKRLNQTPNKNYALDEFGMMIRMSPYWQASIKGLPLFALKMSLVHSMFIGAYIQQNRIQGLEQYILQNALDVNGLVASLPDPFIYRILQTLILYPNAAVETMNIMIRAGLNVNMCYESSQYDCELSLLSHVCMFPDDRIRLALLKTLLLAGADLNLQPSLKIAEFFPTAFLVTTFKGLPLEQLMFLIEQGMDLNISVINENGFRVRWIEWFYINNSMLSEKEKIERLEVCAYYGATVNLQDCQLRKNRTHGNLLIQLYFDTVYFNASQIHAHALTILSCEEPMKGLAYTTLPLELRVLILSFSEDPILQRIREYCYQLKNRPLINSTGAVADISAKRIRLEKSAAEPLTKSVVVEKTEKKRKSPKAVVSSASSTVQASSVSSLAVLLQAASSLMPCMPQKNVKEQLAALTVSLPDEPKGSEESVSEEIDEFIEHIGGFSEDSPAE